MIKLNYYIIKSETDGEIDFIIITDRSESEVLEYLSKANDVFYNNCDDCYEDVVKSILPESMTLISGCNVYNIYN